MKRSILISLAGLTLVAACTESLTRPTDVADASNGRLTPQGPLHDDIVSSSSDFAFDAVAKVMSLNVNGSNGSTTLYVLATGTGNSPADGKSGCNLQGNQTTVSVSVASSDVAVATVSPTSLTFDACPDAQTITVTPKGTGSANIIVTLGTNTTPYQFTSDKAAFQVNVTGSTNQTPQISITGVEEGVSYTKGSVPNATCSVTDPEDGNSTFAADLSAIVGDDAAGGIGEQTATCVYFDKVSGLEASSSVTYNIIDGTPPTIGYVLDPSSPDGNGGWYKSNVTLKWTVTEGDSPSTLQTTGCEDVTVSTDQLETTYACSATSSGGSAVPREVKIKRDATAPSNSLTRLPVANTNGWNNTVVEVKYGWADATSGLATCSADVNLTGEGAGQSASGTCADNAGNSVSVPVIGINIDLTPPTVNFIGGPANGSSHYFGSVPSAPTCGASDALSGLDGSCAVTGYSTAVGNHTVEAKARDLAGNETTTSVTYTVLAWTLKGFYQPVDMGGVLNIVKAGSTVPLKFEIFAGATEHTTTASVKSFYASPASCNTSAVTDEVEVTSTGGTTLRYDATEGQFIQNWQTPKTVGLCYRAVMITQDNSQLSALFKLK